ncbi:DNA/RNA-binding protein Kin17, conserved region [Actinidia rufa]|uniref:DNA/RNA-binding protein Kin17, conserved region n=1 Tax=Actinidia rufa TaxID=165716 RepID=A0A7J0DC14_9ERIC|nr:DNA/RNA-binding protein Kin17, conserved region [Actinidia rufa]
MYQKQCWDENVKCHCMSESHQRQMEVVGQNPNRILRGVRDLLPQPPESQPPLQPRGRQVHRRPPPRLHELPSVGYAHRVPEVFGAHGEVQGGGDPKRGAGQPSESEPKHLEKSENGEKIKLSLGSLAKPSVKELALDDLTREQEKAKERINRKDYWLCENHCEGLEQGVSKLVLRVDQDQLETVIPQIGGLVSIVIGAYHGLNSRLLAVDTDKFCAKVQIEKRIYDGRVGKLD